MRILILAAGEATRWGGYLDTPKHLVRLLGEPILARSIRLIREMRPDADVRIVLRDPSDDRYHLPGATIEQARLDDANGGADKFLSSAHLWDAHGRTVLLYGDCYLTRRAMTAILDESPHEGGWHVVARFNAGTFTGTPWGENFAHVIDPEAQGRYLANLKDLAARYARGEIWRVGGWEQYAMLAGGYLDDPAVNIGHATDIDDWSDDFDYPDDYNTWCQRYAAATPALQKMAE